jgi:uncharacterized protein (DUF2141 family)
MKIITSLVLLGVLILNSSFITSSNRVVKVQLKNIAEYKGTAYVNLYSSANFPKKGKELQQKKVKIKANTAYVTFSVPNGNYAIAMYHDVNDNNEMDKNWVGYPQEPYGFSKNFKPTISEPDFDDCKFIVNNADVNLTINLID